MEEFGNYYLVLQDRATGEKLYMDFQGEQCFVPRKNGKRINVPLAAIDELTSNFINETHMKMVLTKQDDLGVPENKIFITYQQLGEKRIDCVYDDEVLAHIASKTKGAKKGLLDLSDEQTKKTLYAIFQELIRFGSPFLKVALANKDNTTFVNNHNATLIREIARRASEKQSVNDKTFRSRFIKEDAFGSYKEFRGLYISYKAYMEERRKINENLLKGILKKDEVEIKPTGDPKEEEELYAAKEPIPKKVTPPPVKKEEKKEKEKQLDMFDMFGDAFKR